MSRRAGERIYYIIPEDGDEETHPNYFFLPGPSGLEVKLNDIKHFFPLGPGYHFRFLQKIGGFKAWVDIGEDTAGVPRYDGAIFFKASRLIVEDESRLGGLKSFFANAVGAGEEESQPVGKLKSYISKALFQQNPKDDDSPEKSPVQNGFQQKALREPLRRAQSASAPRPPRNDDDSPTSTTRFRQQPETSRGSPRMSPASRSSSNLQEQTRAASANRTVTSSSPPKFAQQPPQQQVVPPPPPPQQQASPPPPLPARQQASDLLGLDHSPLHGTQAHQNLHSQTKTKPTDWHAFVGLDSAPQPPPAQPPMRNAGMDPFAMNARPHSMQNLQQQQPPKPQQPQQYQQQQQQQQQQRPGGPNNHNFDAFMSF